MIFSLKGRTRRPLEPGSRQGPKGAMRPSLAVVGEIHLNRGDGG